MYKKLGENGEIDICKIYQFIGLLNCNRFHPCMSYTISNKHFPNYNFALMEEPRKYILDKFQEYLHLNFQKYCDRHGIEKTDGQFVTFLIDHDLISAPHLQRYTVLQEFEKICAEQPCPKTVVVDTLADRFGISERTVWSILKHGKSNQK